MNATTRLGQVPEPHTGAAPQTSTVVYESEHTRITVNGSTARKEALGAGGLDRTRHEARILRRLAGIPGVVQLDADCRPDEIVLADAGAPTLADLVDGAGSGLGGLDQRARLRLALELARTVAAVHRAGVVHGDLNPANILVAADDGTGPHPTLIDFHLATTFVQGVPGFAHHREIRGTLPYLAPEQTGRVGTTVDERADLYGLGATLYELLTGCPPFDSADALTMVHQTLTRVPVPPIERDPGVPAPLSEMIVKLLEKEPDRRYQSADGLAHDLARLLADLGPDGPGPTAPFPLGERDFPGVLRPPTRLVGRDAEINALRTAFDGALTGGSRAVLVAGAPGVGKSALVNTLRSAVTGRRGWFVAGKYDQYRRDLGSDAIALAMRALARLLLAGTQDEVTQVRSDIVDAVGPNLELLTILPEYAALLDLPATQAPDAATGDARELAARQVRTGLDLLRAVASPQRPLVMVIDDIQWAGHVLTGFLDAVVTDERLAGLFVVGVYRDGEVGVTHPLTAAMDRWERLTSAPTRLRLHNLPADDLGALLGEMLRLPPSEVAPLAELVGERSDGNPFDTVELLNALRRDGGLVADAAGLRWDAASIRAFVGDRDVADLLVARIDQLPGPSVELLELLALLGGEVTLDVLGAAAGLDEPGVRERLQPALEDGLLLWEADRWSAAVRFRHDRVQQAAHGRSEPLARRDLHLAMARRLARAPAAAEQYLHAVELTDPADVLEVLDADDVREAVASFLQATPTARAVDLVVAERFVGAALRLLDAGPSGRRPATERRRHLPAPAERSRHLTVAERLWHTVLYDRGRLDDADAAYARIEARESDPVELAGPAGLQITSLTARGRAQDAVDFGLGLLRRLGVDVPDGDLGPDIRLQFDELAKWVPTLSVAADLRRPEPEDPRVLAIARLIGKLISSAFGFDPSITFWLTLTSRRQWERYGPCALQVSNLSAMPPVGVVVGADYRIGCQVLRHALEVGQRRGYEPQTSAVWHTYSLGAVHWSEPLENGLTAARRAQEGLIQGGDLQDACYALIPGLMAHLDCAPSLESGLALADSALEFCSRNGNDHLTRSYLVFRQFARAQLGRASTPGGVDDGGFHDDGFDEAHHLASVSDNQVARALLHTYRAVSAVVFGDSAGLIAHAAAATGLLRFNVAMYTSALIHLVQGLALARRVRDLDGAERVAVLADLDASRDWLAERALDAPFNFGHLAAWLDAERAWALGDRWAAVLAFDGARRQVGTVVRPWHQAAITERAALFHLEHGLRESGHALLVEARAQYAAWSANGKVRRLDAEHPLLGSTSRRRASSQGPSSTGSHSSADVVDMTAVLRSSQALGSETKLEGLLARVGEVLGAITGATEVLLVLRSAPDDPWRVWDTGSGGSGGSVGVPLDEAGLLLPVSAVRYVERTGDALVIRDGATDDRFSADPYLAGVARSSALVVPLFREGALRSILVLGNRRRVGAFADDGLTAVEMISSQLVASLHNVRLLASLEDKVVERTQALEEANNRLEVLSLTDALTQLPNRRHFDLLLESEWARGQVSGRPLGLAMVDVDQFKLFNDHYGHPAGDECLRIVARALRGALRDPTDTVCRYGGEEFAMLFPGADVVGVRSAAERARAAVEAVTHPHARSDRGIVTVSVGVASTVPVAEGPDGRRDRLLDAADAGLYVAKKNGRNRTGVAPIR